MERKEQIESTECVLVNTSLTPLSAPSRVEGVIDDVVFPNPKKYDT